jgi:PAS domain S-box-containing protein
LAGALAGAGRWGSLSLRLGAVFIALLIAAALAVGWLFDRGRAEALQQRHLEQSRHQAESGADEVQGFIRRLQQDVLFLAQTPPVQGMRRALEGGGTDAESGSSLQQWQQRLQQILLAFGEAKPEYFQLRLIGVRDGGRELVRVERTADGLHAIAAEALQRKGDRYYYREAAGLAAGSLYLSRIDLNREAERITTPHRPTLRAATPVHAPNGELFGIVIVNMDMGYALQRAQSLIGQDETLYVVNETGDFIVHPEPGRAFAFDLGPAFRLQDAFPYAAARLADALSGETGFVALRDRSANAIAYTTVRAWDPRNPDRRLLFITTAPTALLRAAAGLPRTGSLLGMGALLLLAVGLVILTVRRATRSLSALARASDAIADGDYQVALPTPDNSETGRLVRAFRNMTAEVQRREESLAQLNRELEQRVHERTRALARQHDMQHLILESIADGVVVVDDQGRFILWNRKAEQIIGCGAEEVPPERWSSHFGVFRDEAGEPLPAEELPLVRAMHGEPTDTNELYLRHPTRTEGCWTQVTARPLRNPEGSMTGAVAVLVDLTEQKRLQAQLHGHRADLVKLGELALGTEIASAAAHQLSQPIAAICSYAAATTRLQAAGRLDEQSLRDMLRRIECLSDQCGEILDRLRARIRRRQPARIAFEPSRAVASALDFMKERIHRHGIKVEQHVASDLPQLLGDPLELEHALIQLLSNALEAMESTPRQTRRLSVRTALAPLADGIRIEITDTGPGVNPQLADRLFEPWETDKPGALGIGLTIAQAIVETFGGQIRLEGTGGAGALFRIDLPRPPEERT